MVNVNRSKNNNWSIGAIVNIGFMKNLKVVAIQAIKDSMPDIYTLESINGTRYEFIPHNGLHKI
jgi:hypothetical protein